MLWSLIENSDMSRFESAGFGYALFRVNNKSEFECLSESSEFIMFRAISGKTIVSEKENEKKAFSIEAFLKSVKQTGKKLTRDVNTLDHKLFNVSVDPLLDDHFLIVVNIHSGYNQNKVFFQIAERSNVGILIADSDGTIRYCNQRIVDILKSPSCKETMKINLLKFPLLKEQGFVEKLKESLNKGISQVFEAKYKSKWGKASWLRIYFEPEFTNSNLTGIWIFIDDICDEVEAKSKLEQNESNFRSFFDSIHDMIFVSDLEGNMLTCNNTVSSKLLFSKNELLQKNLLDLYRPEDREEATQILNEMLQGKRENCPLPLQSKAGFSVPVETRAWLGFWNGQKCLYGISKDISKEQEALQKFNRFFDSNPALMAVSSFASGCFTDVNNTFLQTLGYKRDEVVGKSTNELDIFVDPERHSKVIENLLQTGSVRDVELKVKTKAGAIIDGLFSGEIIQTQGDRLFLTVMTDISEKNNAERLLQREVEAQQLLFKVARSSIDLSVDEVDIAVHAYFEMIGLHINADRVYVFDYDFEHEIMKNTCEWCAQGIQPEIDNLQAVPFAAIPEWVERHVIGEAFVVNSVKDLPDGNLKDILEPQNIKSLITFPLIKGDKPMGFIGFDFVKDYYTITEFENRMLVSFSYLIASVLERRENHVKLVDSNQKLEIAKQKAELLAKKADEANKAKGNFLANMSHEIRTPLNGIVGFASLLEETELSDEQASFVNHIASSAKSLMAIINDVLDLSKIEDDKVLLNEDFEQIIPLCEEVLDLIGPVKKNHEVELIFNLKNAPPAEMEIDAFRFRQIITNLLGNAAKFTTEGRIELQLSFQDFNPDDCTISMDVSVIDTGIGIKSDVIQRLLDPFVQADSSTSKKYGGTGLGLTISERLIRMMGGQLQIESEVGKGSVFSFSLRKKVKKYPIPTLKSKSDLAILLMDESSCLRHNENLLRLFYHRLEVVFTKEDLMRVSENETSFILYCDETCIMSVLNQEEEIPEYIQTKDVEIVVLRDSLSAYFTKELKEKLNCNKLLWINKPMTYTKLNHLLGNNQQDAMLLQGMEENETNDFSILVVEDVEINRLLVRRILEKNWANITIYEAVDGREAIHEALDKKPDLILMDIQMPEVNGFEAFEEIHRLVGDNMMPVVALTASATNDIRDKAMGLGMKDVLLKPLTIGTLKAVIQKYVNA